MTRGKCVVHEEDRVQEIERESWSEGGRWGVREAGEKRKGVKGIRSMLRSALTTQSCNFSKLYFIMDISI